MISFDLPINSSNNQKWLKGLGIYQIVGGALGLVITSISCFPFDSAGWTLLFIPCCFLFGFSIFSGWTTFKLMDSCINLTFANQALQLFAVFIGQFEFDYFSGLGLNITADFTKTLLLGFEFNFSTIDLSFNQGQDKYFIGLNLIALFIIYKVEKIKRDISR